MSKSGLHAAAMAEFQQLYWPQRAQSLSEAKLTIKLALDTNELWLESSYPIGSVWQAELRALLYPWQKYHQLSHCSLQFRARVKAQICQAALKPRPSIKNIVLIGSGKGGVGKSTVALRVAQTLQLMGVRVGLLDADLFGPSLPSLTGHTATKIQASAKIEPIIWEGLQTLSISFLLRHDAPVVWRGPMASRALEQLVLESNWDNLDYLIVDLPPGTSDLHLTLCQRIPIAGALIVTTPHALALSDARKAIQMFDKLSVTTLGLLENMSEYHCPHCHQSSQVFGGDAGTDLALEFNLELFAKIPLFASLGAGFVTSMTPAEQSHYAQVTQKLVHSLGMRPQHVHQAIPVALN